MSKYTMKRGGRIYFGDEFLGSIYAPNREVDESRLDGESWLQMRARTLPHRERNAMVSDHLAQVVVDFLNENCMGSDILTPPCCVPEEQKDNE